MFGFSKKRITTPGFSHLLEIKNYRNPVAVCDAETGNVFETMLIIRADAPYAQEVITEHKAKILGTVKHNNLVWFTMADGRVSDQCLQEDLEKRSPEEQARILEAWAKYFGEAYRPAPPKREVSLPQSTVR